MENLKNDRKVMQNLVCFTVRKLRLKLREVMNEQTRASLERFEEIATEREINAFRNRLVREIEVNMLINLLIKLNTALIDTEYSSNNTCLGKRVQGYMMETDIVALQEISKAIAILRDTDFTGESRDYLRRTKNFFLLIGDMFGWGDEIREWVCNYVYGTHRR